LPTVAVILKVFTTFVHQLSNRFAPSSRTEKHELIFTTLCNSSFTAATPCTRSWKFEQKTTIHPMHITFPLRKGRCESSRDRSTFCSEEKRTLALNKDAHWAPRTKCHLFLWFGEMARQNRVKSAKGFGWCWNAKAKLAHCKNKTFTKKDNRQRFLFERMIYPTIHNTCKN
jgi:hypothetical protein